MLSWENIMSIPSFWMDLKMCIIQADEAHSLISDLCSISSYVKMEISQFFLVTHSGFPECSLYEYRSILNLCSFFLKKERSVSHYLGKYTHTHTHTCLKEFQLEQLTFPQVSLIILSQGNSITFVFMDLFRLFLLHLRYIKITNFCRDLSRPEY